ncbi:MAG: hypothetical protein ABEJ56_03135 [Candidatus Nanohaloarchaea archaeon]
MKKSILLIISLLIVGSVSAFEYQFGAEDRVSSKDDPAEFNLKVTNTYNNTDRFRISSVEAPPAVSQWFDYEFSKRIPPGEERNFSIKIHHQENVLQQNYAFILNLRSFRQGELKRAKEYFTVRNPTDLEITSFSTKRKNYDPGEKVKVELAVRSTASGRIENLSVEASMMDQKIRKNDSSLGPGDSIRYNFELMVPEDASPGPRKIKAVAYKSGERNENVSTEINVNKVERIEREVERSDRLLRNRMRVEVENNGNTETGIEVRRSIPIFSKPFTSTDPEASSVSTEGGETVYLWKTKLEPGEKASFGYSTDYSPLLVFLALFAVGALGIRKLQAGIAVSKRAERNETGIEVLIELKNDSGRLLEYMEVRDFVPDIAEVGSEFEMAKPVQTKKSNGTELSWSIERLEPGEERVMKYSIRPLVKVEGGAVLPGVEVFEGEKKVKNTSGVEVDFHPG